MAQRQRQLICGPAVFSSFQANENTSVLPQIREIV